MNFEGPNSHVLSQQILLLWNLNLEARSRKEASISELCSFHKLTRMIIFDM